MNDSNLHLFADDREIHQYINVMRVVNRPKRLEEPVIRSDKPWEKGCKAWAWGSVLKEKNCLLRMWYFSFNAARAPGTLDNGGYCYAESRDGINWIKPNLGIVDWNGSKDNNFFITMGMADCQELARRGGGFAVKDIKGNSIGVVNNMDGLTVVRDEDEEDPDKRYKLLANMQDHRMWTPYYRNEYPDVTQAEIDNAMKMWGQYMLTSPDGLHWNTEPVLIKSRCHGDYMMVTRDERNRQWWLNERPIALKGRNAGLSMSRDMLHWTEPTEMAFFNGAESGFGNLWEWHGGITPFNYGNQDIGFLEKWCNVGFGDVCELAGHRDGEPWQRVAPGQVFLDIGPEGSFDRGLVYPLHNEPIEIDGKLYIYYSGGSFKNETDCISEGSIGVAVIGLDRFAALANRRLEPGMILTKVQDAAGNILQINVEPFSGEVKVAVRNSDNTDIPGYSLDDCIPVNRNEVRARVYWKEHGDLCSLRGRKVRLCFQVKAAALYSYRWTDREKN